MKKVSKLLIMLFLVIFLIGCDALLARASRVTVAYTVEDIKLEGLPPLLETVTDWNGQDIPFPSVLAVSGKKEFSTEVARAGRATSVLLDAIDTVQLKKFELRLSESEPLDKDIGFIKSIYVIINAEGLDTELFAYVDDVDKDARVISMVTSDDNLADYFKQDTFEIRVIQASAQEIPGATEYTFDLEFEVFVDVDFFGY